MFCKYCGREIKNTEKFCGNCGRIFDMNEEQLLNPSNKFQRNKLIKLIIPIVVIIIVVMLGGYIKENTGYKAVLNKYFKALETADGDLWRSIICDVYIDDLIDGWGYTEKELLENYQEALDETMVDYIDRVGRNVKITYEITDSYIPDNDELHDLNRWMEDYGFEDYPITDAIVVECEYVVTGEDGSGTKNCEMLLIEVDGDWYRAVGYIDLSWYEQ